MHDVDTDPMDIDGAAPLTPPEIAHLRRVLRNDDRTSWAMRKLRVFTPVLVAFVVGAWQLWDWAAKHLRVTP